ncbi:hypothetical protein [Vibrio sp. SCSIO 43136]|uniref:hypothetical protein n=1 Tax=Vibrio sp. SCSIO 43136 TaxID=2819101 RepID=UPI002074DA4A|nr:hypothetical protein [Vibrio sp. SCSIO 43136]USD67156.1 hypothetical protein J4N39_21200 [Vibrio sp. SCSIO 43136]
MKKYLPIYDREWAKRRTASKRNRIRKKRSIFDGKSSIVVNGKTLQTLFNKPIYEVPRILDISGGQLTNELKTFFDGLEELCEKFDRIYLTFKKTEVARYPMYLIIVAIQEKYGTKISVMWSDSPGINYQISTTGFYLASHKRREMMRNSNIGQIPVISGSNQEFGDLADDLVDAISDKYYDGSMPSEVEFKISQAIIETVENVGRHAYPHVNDNHDKKWWLICSIGDTDYDDGKHMFLAIYDTGRGIPMSFEDSHVFQHRVKSHYPEEYNRLIQGSEATDNKKNVVRALLRTAKSIFKPLRETIGDSGMIYASMMHEVTRIDDQNHGQGSISIKDVVTDDPGSHLIITSDKGWYQYDKGAKNEDGMDDEHSLRELANSMPGTFIQWSIKLHDFD